MEVPNSMQKSFKDMNFREKICHVFKNITLEPVCFIFAMNWGFYGIAASELYIQKMCRVNLNNSVEICDDLYSYPEMQNKNQEMVTNLKVKSRVVQSIPPLVYAMIAGPWSDKHGRKPLIVLGISGYILANGIFLINTVWYYELKAEYLLLECLQGKGNIYT